MVSLKLIQQIENFLYSTKKSNQWISIKVYGHYRDQDSDDDEIEKKLAELALQGAGDDDDDEDIPKPKSKKAAKKKTQQKQQAVSAFAMLDMDDGGASDRDDNSMVCLGLTCIQKYQVAESFELSSLTSNIAN